MLFFAKAWAWLKKYWGIVALIMTAIIGLIMFRKRSSTFVEDMQKLQATHDAELKKIDDARLEERRMHEENLKKRDEMLLQVQKQYEEAKKDLDSKKKAEIEKLLKKYNDNPIELAKQISQLSGFTVILPE